MRLAAVRKVHRRLECALAEQAHAFVGMADRMRGDDHVVHFQQRIVGRNRLLLEHIDGGPGDAMVLQCIDECRFHDDRAARRIDEIRAWLHEREFPGADQAPGLFIEQRIDRYVVRLFEQRVLVDHGHAERRHRRLRDIRIAAQQLHSEGLCELEYFLADVADADDAKRAPHQSAAEIIPLLRPASLTSQPVLEEHAMREREHEADHAGCHRTAYAVRRNRQQDTVPGARRHIDRIVADAEARNQFDFSVRGRQRLARHFRRHQAYRVVLGGILRRNFGHFLREKLPFDRRILEHLECFFTEYRAVRCNRVTRYANFEFRHCSSLAPSPCGNHIAALNAPSVTRIWPFTKDASSDARKTATGPISSSLPQRPAGVRLQTQSLNSLFWISAVFISVAK